MSPNLHPCGGWYSWGPGDTFPNPSACLQASKFSLILAGLCLHLALLRHVNAYPHCWEKKTTTKIKPEVIPLGILCSCVIFCEPVPFHFSTSLNAVSLSPTFPVCWGNNVPTRIRHSSHGFFWFCNQSPGHEQTIGSTDREFWWGARPATEAVTAALWTGTQTGTRTERKSRHWNTDERSGPGIQRENRWGPAHFSDHFVKWCL